MPSESQPSHGPPSGRMPDGSDRPLPEGALPLRGWRQTFSSLSGNPEFRLLFIGNIGFFFGMSMMIILRGWLVVARWDSPALLGYLMATVAIPMLVLSPIGGVVTDRVDKRKLLIVAQTALVAVNAVVAALIVTDTIEFWHLAVASSLSGAAFSFNMPGRQALVAQLVPRDRLMNAMSLSTAAMNASRIVAPPIAGLLIAPIGIGGAYIITTVFYAVAVIATYALPAMPSKREREFTFFEDFVGGFSYIRRTPVLLGLLVFATVPMIFAMPYMILLPVFANDVFNVGSSGFGIMQAATGVGGLVGALIVANLDAYPKKMRLLVAGGLAFGGFLFLFAVSPWFGLALVFLSLIGFGSMLLMTVNNTAIQLIIPDEVRGRVMSVMMMTFGLMPLGAVPAGVAAESVGVRPVVATGAVLCVAAMLLIIAIMPAFRRLDESLEEGRARQEAERLAAMEEEAGGSAPALREPFLPKPASASAD
ncbi:MAG: MFS transporter [Chloroflexi bacterium]|nr:MFS transporter [Chloroflexota bacterium]